MLDHINKKKSFEYKTTWDFFFSKEFDNIFQWFLNDLNIKNKNLIQILSKIKKWEIINKKEYETLNSVFNLSNSSELFIKDKPANKFEKVFNEKILEIFWNTKNQKDYKSLNKLMFHQIKFFLARLIISNGIKYTLSSWKIDSENIHSMFNNYTYKIIDNKEYSWLWIELKTSFWKVNIFKDKNNIFYTQINDWDLTKIDVFSKTASGWIVNQVKIKEWINDQINFMDKKWNIVEWIFFINELWEVSKI